MKNYCKKPDHKKKYRRQSGFTFLEVIVVVAILSLLATLLITRYSHSIEDAKIKTARLNITEISKSLELYKLDNGFYPTMDQGLQALVEKPESSPEPKKWKQYIKTVPLDPWGNEYIYIQPGSKSPYDLFSRGPDGVESEDDITEFETEENKR